MSGELWLPIPGHDGYEASDHGRVRSLRVLVPAPNSKGYLKVHLGRAVQIYVHQAVLLAHQGPCPTGYTVDHDDFDPTNNALPNLAYMWKPYNDFRWQRNQKVEDIDPAELARIDATYQAAVARGEFEQTA